MVSRKHGKIAPLPQSIKNADLTTVKQLPKPHKSNFRVWRVRPPNAVRHPCPSQAKLHSRNAGYFYWWERMVGRTIVKLLHCCNPSKTQTWRQSSNYQNHTKAIFAFGASDRQTLSDILVSYQTKATWPKHRLFIHWRKMSITAFCRSRHSLLHHLQKSHNQNAVLVSRK